jgi:hypothetical protein
MAIPPAPWQEWAWAVVLPFSAAIVGTAGTVIAFANSHYTDGVLFVGLALTMTAVAFRNLRALR